MCAYVYGVCVCACVRACVRACVSVSISVYLSFSLAASLALCTLLYLCIYVIHTRVCCLLIQFVPLQLRIFAKISSLNR